MSTRQYVCDALSKWSQHNLILLAILYLFSSTTHTDTLAQQPTAYWSFDEGQGSTLHDESGNGNDGTIYQAQWTDGFSYAALDFDGVNDYVNIGNRLHNVNVPFSVTAWVNTRGTQQAQMIFDSDARVNDYYGFWFHLGYSGGGRYSLGVNYGDGGFPAPYSRRSKYKSSVIQRSTWTFVAAVVRGAINMSLYVDGVDVGGSYSGSGEDMKHSGDLAIIGRLTSNNQAFDGKIDELRIYNTDLSPQQIRYLFDVPGQSQHPQDNMWTIKWFHCDAGHENPYPLYRDGRPVCGTDNCPGDPGTCWGAPVVEQIYAFADIISWDIDEFGAIDLEHKQDVQVYGDTYLYVSSPTSFTIPLLSQIGAVWLEDRELTAGPSTGTITLDLEPGWSHLEFTCYHQHGGGGIKIVDPIAKYVDWMRTVRPYGTDINDNGIVNFIDYAILLEYWNKDFPPFDIVNSSQADPILNILDLRALAQVWLSDSDY